MSQQIVEDILRSQKPTAEIKDKVDALLGAMQGKDKREALKATVKQLSREDLENLRSRIVGLGVELEENEGQKFQEVARSEDMKRVKELETFLDEVEREAVVSPTAAVSDIAPAKPDSQKNFFEKMVDTAKGMGLATIGGALRQIIGFVNMISPPKTPEEKRQRSFLENLYERFFGVAELQERMNTYLQSKAGENIRLRVVPGTGDKVVYAGLKARFLEDLTRQLQGKSVEEQEALREAFTFELFAKEKMDAYLAAQKSVMASPQGDGYVTTLKGVAENLRPRERPTA